MDLGVLCSKSQILILENIYVPLLSLSSTLNCHLGITDIVFEDSQNSCHAQKIFLSTKVFQLIPRDRHFNVSFLVNLKFRIAKNHVTDTMLIYSSFALHLKLERHDKHTILNDEKILTHPRSYCWMMLKTSVYFVLDFSRDMKCLFVLCKKVIEH